MDVLCAGMYRACSTWQYEVIAHLLERHRDGERLGYLTGEQYASAAPGGVDLKGWRVLKSHEGHRGFSRAVRERRAFAIYSHRDIRDVVFSLMHKRGVSFESLVRQGMIHQILVNDRFWTSQPGVLIQRYERLINDPARGVEQIAVHLGIELAEGEAREIAAEYSFQTNRRRTLELVQRLRSQGVDLDDPTNLQYYDQHSLLHWNHMREGRPAPWREQATRSQRAILSRLCDRWLIDHDYEAGTIDPRAESQGAADILRREAELARAAVACTLRCASLRYPRSARLVKRCLGIACEPVAAVAARPSPSLRVDTASNQVAPPRRQEPQAHPSRDDSQAA